MLYVYRVKAEVNVGSLPVDRILFLKFKEYWVAIFLSVELLTLNMVVLTSVSNSNDAPVAMAMIHLVSSFVV